MGGSRAIRSRLILAAALASGAVLTGALLQYRALQVQEGQVTGVRAALQASRGLGEAALALARERGRTHGLFAVGGVLPQVRTDLQAARARVDGRLAAAQAAGVRTGALLQQLADLRSGVDRGRVPLPRAFDRYTALVSALNDDASTQLSTAMLAIGQPYEHVNTLREAVDYAGQCRGLINGALVQGRLTPQAVAEARQRRLLADTFAQRAVRLSPAHIEALAGPEWRTWQAEWARFDADPDGYARSTPAQAWWAVSTAAIDALQADLDAQVAASVTHAEARLQEIRRRALAVAMAMVVLGLVTVALLYSTLVRVARGLGRLVRGIEHVTTHQDLAARVDEGDGDEFGRIGHSVNTLVGTIAGLVAEKEARAESDGLTGLLNRTGLDRQLAARTNPQRQAPLPFGLLLVDIDHFKRINDDGGHLQGDRVLAVAASVLARAIRPDDIVGRWGGEEFLVVLAGADDVDLAAAAEKVREAIASADMGIGRPVTASVGASTWRVGEPLADAFARADEALYAAKAGGRNRCVVAGVPAPVAP